MSPAPALFFDRTDAEKEKDKLCIEYQAYGIQLDLDIVSDLSEGIFHSLASKLMP